MTNVKKSELLAILGEIQNSPKYENHDIMSITGAMTTQAELEQHIIIHGGIDKLVQHAIKNSGITTVWVS